MTSHNIHYQYYVNSYRTLKLVITGKIYSTHFKIKNFFLNTLIKSTVLTTSLDNIDLIFTFLK